MNKLQLFAPYDDNAYCDFSASAAQALAGKDVLLCVFDSTGASLLAIAGQQSLTVNRSADTIEATSKDTQGGWKSYIAGAKEWSIDSDGLFIADDASQKQLSEAFENSTPLCVKVVNVKAKKGMYGGLAIVTDFPVEAPYDDSVTYTITLTGMGALVDLAVTPPDTDTMPQGYTA